MSQTQRMTAKDIIADLSPELQAEYASLSQGNTPEVAAVGISAAGEEVAVVGNSEPLDAIEASTDEDATDTTQESQESDESDDTSTEDQLSKLKEQRKRMFAEVNKLKAENEKLSAEQAERNKLIEEARELAGEDAPEDKIQKSINDVFEKQDFIKKYQPSSDELSAIKEIKATTGLTWEKAALLHTAETNPSMLVDQTTARKANAKQTVDGVQPNINQPAKDVKDMSFDELRELALKDSIHRF
jgi:regulator of replication initiation timing